MRRLALLALLPLLALAGCAGPNAPPGATTGTGNGGAPAASGPSLALSEFEFMNPDCADATTFKVTVANLGNEAATKVMLRATGGYQDHESSLGDIPPGGRVRAEATVHVNDVCGQEDLYTLTITATPSNAAESTMTARLST